MGREGSKEGRGSQWLRLGLVEANLSVLHKFTYALGFHNRHCDSFLLLRILR